MGFWQAAKAAWNRIFNYELKKRAYAGSAINRLTSDWIASSTSADSELRGSLRVLRNRSRELCRNNDYAKGALRTITNNVVGKGIPLQSQVKKKRGDKLDEPINTAIEELWVQWQNAKYCDVRGKLCFADIERLLMRSIVESGEVLVRLVRQPFGGSPVPLALEIIEADQLCDEYTSATIVSGNQIRMGVEVDAWQRPVAYWLYPHHPGDYQFHFKTNELLRIPASQVLHLYICDRPGQTRGVPWFHTALMRLRHVGGFEEAELVAARAQASVMGFIQTPDGGELLGETYNGERVSSLAPGAIEVLGPGETFAGFAPTRPNQGFDPFVRMMLRAVASGVGMSYEALSSDYSNTSYSSARTALLDERDNYRIVQDWLIKNFHEPVFELWLELAVMVGALNLPMYELNPRFYQKTRWVPRGWQWVDPQNEVSAYKEAIKAGFTTTSQVVAQSGLDIEDVLKERRRELDLASESEVGFDTTIEAKEEKGESLLAAFEPKEDEVVSRQVTGGKSYVVSKSGLTTYDLRPTTYNKRAKNCKKGKACGDSCISATKNCRKTLTPAATAATPTVAAGAPKKTSKKGKISASILSAGNLQTDATQPPAASGASVVEGLDSDLSIKDVSELASLAKKMADKTTDKKIEERLLHNADIWRSMESELKVDSDEMMGGSIKDSNGRIVAGILYKNSKKGTEIEWLATHPDNIEKNKNAVKGAGTQAVLDVVSLAVKTHKKSIKLIALKDAIPFYKKLGFKTTEIVGDGDATMSLSHQNALKLLSMTGKNS